MAILRIQKNDAEVFKAIQKVYPDATMLTDVNGQGVVSVLVIDPDFEEFDRVGMEIMEFTNGQYVAINKEKY